MCDFCFFITKWPSIINLYTTDMLEIEWNGNENRNKNKNKNGNVIE